MRSALWTRAIRILCVIVILSIAWLQLALPALPRQESLLPESLEPDPALLSHQNPIEKIFNSINFHLTNEAKKELTIEEIIDIREQISLRSQNETLLNEELFGSIQSDTIVIVVQVHNRLSYLRHLIVSLAQARYIDSVLLIFSHDFYDEQINKLVTTIDFCKVMQIFYPHALQTHPHSFPGESLGDCPRDTSKEQVKNSHCVGTPDLYGHFREARYAQTKHHWWWKANKVFDDLWVLRNHTGLVLFLEEDHYVSEDFLHVLMLYSKALPQICPKCSVITLGNYLKNYHFSNDAKRVEIGQWLSSKHNMGFAMNHSVWLLIKNCGTTFCNHDDYNWDWSLQYVSLSCLPQKLFTLTARAPRVFHIGECGVHHKKKDCSSKVILNKVHHTLASSQKYLFPRQLVVLKVLTKKIKKHKGNGGWGDIRDRTLCSSFLQDTSLKCPMAMSVIPDPLDAIIVKETRRNSTTNRKFFNIS